MHDDQISLDLDTARSLIHDQFPQLAHETVRHVPTDGTVNTIFRIGDHIAARFPLRLEDPPTLSGLLRDEADAMAELADRCPFPTPTPVGLGDLSASYPMPWSVQTWISGTVATPRGLADSIAFTKDLVQLIQALRSTDTRGRIFSGDGRGGHLPDHDGWMEHCLRASEGLLDVGRLRVLWARLREVPAMDGDVMSHGDLTPANLLVEGDHLVGVLDGGGFSPADPALDLVAAWHLLAAEARGVLRKALGCSDTEWRRGAAWALQQAMGLVWYYEQTNPGMATLGRSTLQRILDDPDMYAA